MRLTTRCQGSLSAVALVCRIHATWRAARGLPARAAIRPYDATLPAGINRMSFFTFRVNGLGMRSYLEGALQAISPVG